MKSASLNSSLLTRKGAAAPATFLPGAEAPKPAPAAGGPAEAPLLGLHGAHRAPAKPARPAPSGDGRARGARASERTRLSLRLDREQHLKIRLASVHLGKSAQAILLDALERYLEQVAPTLGGGSCRCLGAGAKANGAVRPG